MALAKILFKTTRPPFLVLTPICLALGVSLAKFQGYFINYYDVLLVLIAALMAHISVNTLNEYFDFKSGLDLNTQRTPFSGGSGALPNNPNLHHNVLSIGIASLVVTLVIGLYFIQRFGLAIAPIGILGLILVLSYTQWINKHPFLCLIAPGLGFGLLFVLGTHYVFSENYHLIPLLIALIPFFLVNNLLLLNQYPDIQADKKAGRNHFPIAFGIKKSNAVYALFVLSTIISLIYLVVNNLLPNISLLALTPMPLALFSLSGANKHGNKIGHYPHYLAANVAVTLLVPLVLSISLIYSANT